MRYGRKLRPVLSVSKLVLADVFLSNVFRIETNIFTERFCASSNMSDATRSFWITDIKI